MTIKNLLIILVVLVITATTIYVVGLITKDVNNFNDTTKNKDESSVDISNADKEPDIINILSNIVMIVGNDVVEADKNKDESNKDVLVSDDNKDVEINTNPYFKVNLINANGNLYCVSGKILRSIDEATGKTNWEYSIESGYYNKSYFYYDRLYLFGESDYNYGDGSNILCIDAQKGTKVWDYKGEYKNKNIQNNAIYFIGDVYSESQGRSSTLFCFDVKTGNTIWKTDGLSFLHSLLLSDNKLYVLSDKITNDNMSKVPTNLFCLDILTGVKAWEYQTKDKRYNDLYLSDDRIMILMEDGIFLYLNAITGVKTGEFNNKFGIEENWKLKSKDEKTIKYVDNKIIILSVNHNQVESPNLNYKLVCNDVKTNKEIWSYKAECKSMHGPVLFDNKIFIFYPDPEEFALESPVPVPKEINNHLICFDPLTGKKIWEYNPKGILVGEPVLLNNNFILTTYDHIYEDKSSIISVDAQTGKKDWEYNFIGTVNKPPTIFDSKVFVRTDLKTGDDILYHLALYNPYPYKNSENAIITLSLFCLDVQTGNKVWEYNSEGGIYKDPTFSNDKVFIDTFRDIPICFDTQTGQKLWEWK